MMKKKMILFLSKFARFLLLMTILFLALFGFTRIRGALLSWNYLLQLGIRSTPQYLVISGAVWGTFGSIVFLLLLLKYKFSKYGVWFFLAFLTIGYWAERLLFYIPELRYSQWQFPFLLNVLFISLIVSLTALQPPESINHEKPTV